MQDLELTLELELGHRLSNAKIVSIKAGYTSLPFKNSCTIFIIKIENQFKEFMKTFLTVLLLFPFLTIAQAKHPLTVEDLWAMKRIGSFDLSPDGKTLVFDVTAYSIKENKGNSDIYLINADGTNLHPLKNSEKNEANPQFSPDGKKVAYLIDDQIHTCSLNGSNDVQLTDLYTGVDDFKWSHDVEKILLISSVYPDCGSQVCNKKVDEEKKESKVKVRVLTHLMFRYWNRWINGKRSHLYLFNIASKEYDDLNFKMHNDVPPLDLGSGNDFNFSPDDKEIVFTMNPDTVIATSTNNEIYTAAVSDIKKGEKAITSKISESKGNDNQPIYSPDGMYIAFTSMLVPGHESDQSYLVVFDRTSGKLKNLTKGFDKSVGQFIWSPDSKTIYFTAENEIFNSVYKLDISTGEIKLILKDHSNTGLIVSPDSKTIYFKQQKSTQPYEIYSMNSDGGNIQQITN